MKKRKRILITGHGAPGTNGTMLCLKNSKHYKQCEFVFCDSSPSEIGVIAVPHGDSNEYEKEIVRIVEEHGIDFILPQTEAELLPLSMLNSPGNKLHRMVAISYHSTILRATSKMNLLEDAKNFGVPTPTVYNKSAITTREELISTIKDAGYPDNIVVIKPDISSGSRGIRILDARGKKKTFFSDKPTTMVTTLESLLEQYDLGEKLDKGMMVQEYIPGEEWSVDCYVDPYSREIIAVARKRDSIINGISKTTTVRKNADIERYSRMLAIPLWLTYCFGFQFKYDRFGVPRLLECNPRIQGTMVASMFAGANIPGMALESLICNKPVDTNVNIRNNTKTTRVWDFMSESQ